MEINLHIFFMLSLPITPHVWFLVNSKVLALVCSYTWD